MLRRWLIVGALALGLAVLAYQLFPGPFYDAAMAGERALAGLATRQVRVDGLRLTYLDGDDGEPLVLLHGFAADKDHWVRVARPLRGRYRIIAPDLPGFGESELPPDGDYSVAAQIGRVGAFVDALGLASFHLGGSSMGGNIAALYAAAHPQRVRSLWLLAPAGADGAAPSEMVRLLREGGPHPLIPDRAEDFGDVLEFVFTRPPFLPGAVRRHLGERAAARAPLLQEIFYEHLLDEAGREHFRTPLAPAVAGLAVPTLVVWGDRDRVLHVSGAEMLGELLPDARVVVLPGVGHLPMLERPAEAAEIFLAFQVP